MIEEGAETWRGWDGDGEEEDAGEGIGPDSTRKTSPAPSQSLEVMRGV